MKRIMLLIILTLAVAGAALSQSTLSKDQYGRFTVTTISAAGSHLTDTSSVYQVPSSATAIVIGGQVDTGKVAFVLQAAMKYSSTASSMKWVTIDSLVGATTHSVKTVTSAYPYIRIIRSRWTGGATKWGATSACYVFPNGVR